MKEKRYFISDAAKELEVESHVLRYWEEELNLEIPRNEMGHRYYREEEIQMLKCIKELKARGFQLKTIKQILSELQEGKGEATKRLREIQAREEEEPAGEWQTERTGETMPPIKSSEENDAEEGGEERNPVSDKVVPLHTGTFTQIHGERDRKMQDFEEIMGRIIGHAMRENSHIFGEEVSEQVSQNVIKEMDYLMRIREEREEKRFQNLDATIRQYQRGKREAAAASMNGNGKIRTKRKKKSRFFQKRGRRTI